MRTVFAMIFVVVCICGVFADSTWVFDSINPISPGNRDGGMVTYDTHRNVLVYTGLFGGMSGGFEDQYQDTWEMTDSGWIFRGADHYPFTQRGWGAFCYDEARRNCVWFGGSGSFSSIDETFVWDGNHWIQKTPTIHPPGSWDNARLMAYDSNRQVCVLVINDQTWEWDGTDWNQIVTTTLPQASQGNATLAFDSNRSVTVLYSKNGDDSSFMEFEGTDWSNISIHPEMPHRDSPAMFYDEVRQTCIIFGGVIYPDNNFSDTWSYDGSTLTQLSPVHTPPAGTYVGAFQRHTGQGIITQGSRYRQINSNRVLDFISETWTWNGTDWTPQTETLQPPQRYNSAMAWDSNRNTLVMFGGAITHNNISRNVYTDTWEYTNGQWIEMTPISHPPVDIYAHSNDADMIFDPVSGNCLLVTGTDPIETWSWNGSQWTQLNISAISDQTPLLAYNSDTSIPWMVAANNTYTWTGSDWLLVASATTPEYAADLAYNTHLSEMTLLTFNNPISKIWTYQNNDWSEVVSEGPPLIGVPHPEMCYDPSSEKIVILGGYSGISFNPWLLSLNGTEFDYLTLSDIASPLQRMGATVCAFDDGLFYFGGNQASAGHFNDLWTIRSEEICENRYTGDVNLDGELTATDAQLCFQIVLGSYIAQYRQSCAADCNGDGEHTALDAQTIFLAVLGSGSCMS